MFQLIYDKHICCLLTFVPGYYYKWSALCQSQHSETFMMMMMII